MTLTISAVEPVGDEITSSREQRRVKRYEQLGRAKLVENHEIQTQAELTRRRQPSHKR